MTGRRLPLYQELYLYGHDEDRHPLIHASSLAVGMAGAVLIDLVLTARITIAEAKIYLRDHHPLAEPVLDATLATIAGPHPDRHLSRRLRVLAADITDRTTGALLASGLLARDTHRRGLGRRRDRYLLTDPAIATRIRGFARDTVRGRIPPDPQLAALCGLIAALSLGDALYIDAPTHHIHTALTDIAHRQPRDVQAITTAVTHQVDELATAVYR